MYLLDDNNEIVDSECGFDHFEGMPCVVIESSGGASPARGIRRRNPDYNKLLGLLFHRLAKTDARINRVVLDSRRVTDFPVEGRVANLMRPYPIDLNTVDIEEFRRMLQRELAQMHRDPNAKRGGNAQKRIRICLDRSIDPDQLISAAGRETGPADEELAPGLTETERDYVRSARVGQGQFRKDLIREYGGRCPITGIEQERLLIASHIKPWKVCTNAERLDSNNGILLSVLVDRLFDEGLVSFSEDGFVLVSPCLSTSDKAKCGIELWHRLPLSGRSKLYMAYHRAVEFKSK
jgi:hypothetical protein